MFFKPYIPCLLLCLLALNSFAQHSTVKTIPILQNGKPLLIHTLCKTRQGYILLGTEQGVYKFDGTAAIQAIPYNSNITSPVAALYEAPDGQLWTGHQNGAIAHTQQGRLVTYEPEEGTPKAAITQFIQDAKGRIWFATKGEGIYYVDGRHLYNIDEADGLSDKNVYALQLTSGGEILAATDQGINICTINGDKKTVQVLSTMQGLPDNLVTTIIPAGNNNYWIGLQDKGYCLYQHDTKNFSQPYTNWLLGQVNSLLYNGNNLWLATQNSGLLQQQSPATNTNIPATALPLIEPVTGLLQDDEANFWVATGNKMIRSSAEKLTVLPTGKGQFANTHALLTGQDGTIWAGTITTVTQYSRNGQILANYKLPGLTASNVITSLYQDDYGTLWAGTMGHGVFLIDNNGGMRQLTELPAPANRSILSISGRGNTVCISSLEGAVLVNLDAANQTIRSSYQCTSYKSVGNIGSSYINSIYKDSKGRLWVASFGKGLTLLQDGKYITYDKTSGLGSNIIYTITEDKQGNIWCSTEDAGLYKFDGKKFTQYATKQGLTNLSIAAIKTDAAGNIVILHKQGLDILNPQTGYITNISSGYGIDSVNAADMGCMGQDSAGTICFSTATGIAVYTAAANTHYQPKTIIEGLRLLVDDIGLPANQSFKHNQNNLSFTFTGLYYSNPEQVQYQYKLEGYNKDWVSTKDRTASFAQLPPGDYTFKVRSSLNTDFGNASEAIYSFTIAKPFWRTWWFILLTIATLGALLYWYIKSREANLKNVERLRQEKIQFQFEVLRNQVNPHFLFNSFNTLISTIEENPTAAVSYVEQLSDFFRNIVNYRDKEIISLKEELGLLHTYYYLQQQRYGTSLQLNIAVPAAQTNEIWIPPLTLQLLLENAVKHNAVSRETPLQVTISSNADSLLVQNNINPKISPSAGAGMGLQNIINRYALLSPKKVQVSNDGKNFIVSLPVIKK